ncbi:major facilitator superfamily domain-containing protein [Immersiella caudata]|uniref:Major facilitator superfamily domain-containing protein n=1 Tax=Immersiella caudata TaxID=314043 RepID=A0AA40C5H1_9PEZI|nr:major facilitator superfamily domain-containing protein [Immersiella caudata]
MMSSISDIRAQIWTLGLLRATEAFAWSSIFPYAYSMIHSFDQVPSDSIPFYTGLLIAVVTLGEFVSSIFWARISDSIGRKPTLLIGTAFGAATALLLGFSRSIGAAVGARALGGLLTANAGIVQTCTGEIARREQQARAFSSVTFIRAVGNLIGVFTRRDSIWGVYPYLLPNVVVAGTQILAFGVAMAVLEETKPGFRGRLSGSGGGGGGGGDETAALVDGAAVKQQKRHVWDAQVTLQIVSISLLAYHKVGSDALIGTFLALPTAQGFGFSTQQIGLVFLSETAFRVAVQFATVSVVIDRLGVLRAYQWVLALYPLAYLLTPFLPNLRLPGPVRTTVLLVDLWSKVALSSVGYVCSAILITNTTPSREGLAQVNGAAASVGCLARSLGPLISGKLLAIGVTTRHVEIAFWALSGVALLGLVEAPFLRDDVRSEGGGSGDE